MFPKTMTFPDWSIILANSTPWSSFPHSSTQTLTNSEYIIDTFGISLSLAFNFSIRETLRTFFAFSTEIPKVFASPATCAGGVRPSRWSRSLEMLNPLSFSLNFSPIGMEMNSGNWLTALRWRNRRKNPLSTESPVRGSLCRLVFDGALFFSVGRDLMGDDECSRVAAGDGTRQLLVMVPFENNFRKAIFDKIWGFSSCWMRKVEVCWGRMRRYI